MTTKIITLQKNESIQYKQLKTQSISSIYNLGKEPLEIKVSIYKGSFYIECVSGGAFIQGWATTIEYWSDGSFVDAMEVDQQ